MHSHGEKTNNSFTRYVCFEGVEATGKSAQLPLVRSHLASLGLKCAVTDEFPADGEVRANIQLALSRSIFVGEGFSQGPLPAFFYMLYADSLRKQSAQVNVDVLLEDRGIDSLAVYQGQFAISAPEMFPIRLHESLANLYRALGIRLPDLTILFVAPLHVIRQRFLQREGRELTGTEIVRIQDLQNAYTLIAEQSDQHRVIDGGQSPQKICQDIVGHILNS